MAETFATTLQDLRFAIRQLRKSPGFTVTAVLVFALGIAASTAIFAFVDAALVKPLPYRNPSRLVALFERIPVGDRFHISFCGQSVGYGNAFIRGVCAGWVRATRELLAGAQSGVVEPHRRPSRRVAARNF